TQRYAKGDSLQANTYAPTSIPITLDTVLKCALKLDAIDLSKFSESDLASPALQLSVLNRIGIDVQALLSSISKESDLMIIEKLRLSQYYSTLTATPTLSDLTSMLATARVRGMSPTDMNAILDPLTFAEIFNISEMHKANEVGNPLNMATGSLSNALGVNWYSSNNCRIKQTPGDAALVVNNKSTAYAAGATTIAFDNGSGSDLAAGDLVKFGAGTTYYTVQSVTWTSTGVSGTMVINALTATDAALAVDDAAIAVVKPNDGFLTNKSCLIFGNKPLPPYQNPSVFEVRVDTDYGSGRFVFDNDTTKGEETIIFEMLVGLEVTEEKFIQKILNIS
ncbi:MAG TPA: hypothetical protein PLG34_12950, partial [Spirochaetota bacterium]|nr:hypothetical protein [Spirochaetota bacterium]